MGVLTLSDLTEEVVASLGNRDDITTARITRAINLTQIRIARVYQWKELNDIQNPTITLTGVKATDKFITVPAIRQVYALLIMIAASEQVGRLTGRNQSWWDSNVGLANYYNVSQMPTDYLEWNGKFEVYPVFDSSLTYTSELRCSLWPTPLSGVLTSDFDNKDDLLIAGATSYLFTTLRMLEDAARWFTIYQSMLTSCILEENTNPDLQMQAFSKYKNMSAQQYWADPFQKINP